MDAIQKSVAHSEIRAILDRYAMLARDKVNAIQTSVARSEIRAVLDRYAMLARDKANWAEFTKCFADDAILHLPNGAEVPPTRLSEVVQDNEARYIRHHVTTVDIKFINSTEARAETYFIAITDSAAPDHWGCWRDTFKVQKDGSWKIQERALCPEGGAPHGWYMQMYGEFHRAPEHRDPHSL